MEKKIKVLKIIGTILSVIGYIGLALVSYFIITCFAAIYGPVESSEEGIGVAFVILLYVPISLISAIVPVVFGIVCLVFSLKIKNLDYQNGKMPIYLFVSSLVLMILPILLIASIFIIPNIFTVA